MNIIRGDVWFVTFPLEEDSNKSLKRPVVVINEEKLEVLCAKITKHSPRKDDDYDTPILYWEAAKLRFESTARVSKTLLLDKSMFIHRIGTLHPDDFKEIEDNFRKLIQSEN
jgi:mRNA-degrading endonuclease toxin of MazEF toxin-antitoxin module